MSAAHKEALARGREEGRAVRGYLEALARARRPGRRRTAASVRARLAVVTEALTDADALARLHLLQEKADLETELARHEDRADLAALEIRFVKVARAYGERKGIDYATWRAAGVAPAVLTRAGIDRGRRG